MVNISIHVPDAWVQENNYVYGIVNADQSAGMAVEAMNESLAEWDYPVRIKDSSECNVMWVDPAALLSENPWPEGYTSKSSIKGWVMVLYANAETLEERG